MKQITTRTHVLLQITLVLCVATYIGLTSHWFIPPCIFYAGSIVLVSSLFYELYPHLIEYMLLVFDPDFERKVGIN